MPPRKQDYYDVLGLTSDATDDAIRTAYKKLALQWHPDRHLVGKERAAQMFVEVNKAYHSLMDGKESAHSSSTETSSTTSVPPSSSAEATHSDTQRTQATSRSPSAGSNSSKQSGSHSSSSSLSDDHSTNASGSSAQSRASPSTPSSSRAPSPDDLKSSSHTRSTSSDRNQPSSDQMKDGRRSSDSHRDPPHETAAKPTFPASRHNRSAGGSKSSVHSKSSERTTGSSPAESRRKNDSHPQKAPHAGSGRSHTQKPVIPPPSRRLHKSPKFGFADEFVHKLSKGTVNDPKDSSYSLPPDQDATPCGSPLRAINTPRGASKEWIFPLPLTLDEMYHGTTYRFLVTRELLSRRTEQVKISIDIPPGMRSGTRILCPRTGHQRKDGTLQDVVFLVEEVPDERFSRVKDDLFMDVSIPWADPLADQGGEICIEGIDGKEITFTLPYPIYDRATEGQVLVKGAGMPVREGCKTISRGDMIVRWRVVFATHQSKWQTLKRALHLDA